MISIGLSRRNNERIARIPKREIAPKKREMMERIFVAIARAIVRIFSISIKVTCGPLAPKIIFLQASVSHTDAEMKYVLGAVLNASFWKEK